MCVRSPRQRPDDFTVASMASARVAGRTPPHPRPTNSSRTRRAPEALRAPTGSDSTQQSRQPAPKSLFLAVPTTAARPPNQHNAEKDGNRTDHHPHGLAGHERATDQPDSLANPQRAHEAKHDTHCSPCPHVAPSTARSKQTLRRPSWGRDHRFPKESLARRAHHAPGRTSRVLGTHTVLVDAAVHAAPWVVLGSGVRRSKLLVPGAYVARTSGGEVHEAVALASLA